MEAQDLVIDYTVFQDSSRLALSPVINVVFLSVCTKFPF